MSLEKNFKNLPLNVSLDQTRSILEAMVDGAAIISAHKEIIACNLKFIDLWRGRGVWSEKPFLMEDLLRSFEQLKAPRACIQRFEETLMDGGDLSYDVLEFNDGRVYELYSRAQRRGEEVIAKVFTVRDVTVLGKSEEQARRYINRLKLLSDASQTFAEARLDFTATLELASRFVSEYFQDGSIVRLFSQVTDKLETVAVYHVDEAAREQLRQIIPRFSELMDINSTKEVLRTGKSVLVAGDVEQIRAKLSPQYWPFIDRYPVQNWIIAPMKVGGKIIGLMTVFRMRHRSLYTVDDQEFLQSLVDRAALAIDNANLYTQAQKAIQLREEFISMASHELKTPLTPLKLQLDVLRKLLQKEKVVFTQKFQKIFKLMDTSDNQITRLTRLIDDMLDVSCINTNQMELKIQKINLSEIAMGVAQEFKKLNLNKEYEIRVNAVEPVWGHWDKSRIEQVIRNLMSNAIKYGSHAPIIINVSSQDAFAVFSIQDFGIGVAKEDQERIFDRFERAASAKRFGGIGLGLYIARQIVLAHDGKIAVTSEPNQGTLFTVHLPCPRP